MTGCTGPHQQGDRHDRLLTPNQLGRIGLHSALANMTDEGGLA